MSLAAENLYVTQSAISNAIKKLEEELGILVLDRLKNGVYLTAAGQEILHIGKNILLEVKEVEQIAAKYQKQEAAAYEGKLTIEMSPQFMLYLIPDVVANFRKCYPQIMLDVYERNPAEIYKNLNEQQFDLYFFLMISKVDDEEKMQALFWGSDYEIQPLGTYRLYAYVDEGHPLAALDSVSLSELLPYTIGMLQYDQNDQEHVTRIFGEIKPPYVFRTNSIYLLLDQIKKGQCIGIVPSVGNVPNGLKRVPIRNNVRVMTYLSYHKNTANIALINQFLTILKKEL